MQALQKVLRLGTRYHTGVWYFGLENYLHKNNYSELCFLCMVAYVAKSLSQISKLKSIFGLISSLRSLFLICSSEIFLDSSQI